MARKLLITLLILSLIFELALTGGAFFMREAVLKQFQVAVNADTDFLGFIIAWFLLFTSMICAFALWQVVKNKEGYSTLCYILGFWWIGIGIGIYLISKRPDNLFEDSLKGLLLVTLTKWSSKR